MKKITNEIRKLIVNDGQIVYKIEEEGCQLIVSEDFKPCLILKFDPARPDFVNHQKEHSSVPDFLYAKDSYLGFGLLIVIEMSSESGKSRTEVKKQLQSGLDNMAKLLQGLSERDWNKLRTYPVYCGNYNKIRRRKSRTETQYVRFRGKNLAIVKRGRKDSISKVAANLR